MILIQNLVYIHFFLIFLLVQNISVPLINIVAHKAPISYVDWNPNGVNFVSASWDHLVSIWDSNNQTCIQQLRGI